MKIEDLPGITVKQARDGGAHQLLAYCSNPVACTHYGVIPLDGLADTLRVRTLGPKARCAKCGHLGADVRPDYSRATESVVARRTYPA
jgi:hypothetical protein